MDRPSKGTFRFVEREFPAVTWYKDPGLRKTYICLMMVVLTSASNGFDGSMVNGLQSLTPWQEYFNHPKGAHLGLFSAIMAVGSILSLPITPYIADGFGRRWGIIIGCSIGLVGVALQGACTKFQMFLAARFLIGFGTSIAHGSSPLLITELAHPQHRAIFATIYNTTWYIGAIIAAWTTYGTNQMSNNWSWRIPSILQGVAPVIQLSFIYFVPESPRFLVAKGQSEKAHSVLAKVHANGNLDDEVVLLEIEEIRTTIKLEQEYESNGWLQLFKTVGMRRRLLILLTLGLFSQWSGNGLASYYLNLVLNDIGITNSNTQLLINGGIQIMNLAVALGQCFVVDRVGRRTLFLISTTGMLVSFTVWTACAGHFARTGIQASGNAVVAMIFLYYVCYNLAWSGMLVSYGAEILPYNLRAKGLTLMFFAVNLALFFNQYVNPVALKDIGWKYYIVYCVWLAIELAVVYFFYIETRYTPLEEIAKYFDGDAALLGGAAGTSKGNMLAAKLDGADGDEKRPYEVEHKEL
ncbi:unnamed protein product [Zymoseptoria tritici ST99CH_1A5]|uniref:Major facilitator superfamily (MFS) profile domain-containing protein n=3 Tax=Zymoseptoria tritici TaxID=1047171 RepID=A0A1X7S0C4_ZYMT9|nr:unnamed protein product [Zymoseptoria tritici ST99CH_3D7]SMR55469.1 unnamed protein product [Zymoseptoria tritici ST99CH_1E4]SMR57843.1 unnamed protein product [Zymoseptoria tritici ST99CH_3D1]SMY26279.1 unnamed protein product [Zymoseptoria tritici ST99CH_1A5]